MDKYLKTLELDKILDMLADLTSNEETRRMALEVRPDNDLERVRYECLKTSQAFSLSVQFGTPPFSNFKDISTVAARAASGAVISLRDLMDIAAMLRQIKALADWYSHCENVETELSCIMSTDREGFAAGGSPVRVVYGCISVDLAPESALLLMAETDRS